MTMPKWVAGPYRKLVELWRASPPDASPRERLVAWCLCAARLGSIGVAVWMALGAVPRWIELPALAVLWTVGTVNFLVLGLPFLLLPFALLWRGIRGEREEDPEYRALEQDAFDSVVAGRRFVAPGPAGERLAFETRGLNLLPGRLEAALHVAAGLALFAAGRPVLGFVYLFPEVAPRLFNAVVRLRAWRLQRS